MAEPAAEDQRLRQAERQRHEPLLTARGGHARIGPPDPDRDVVPMRPDARQSPAEIVRAPAASAAPSASRVSARSAPGETDGS